MARVAIIDERDELADLLLTKISNSPMVEFCQRVPQREGGRNDPGSYRFLRDCEIDTLVYSPANLLKGFALPNIAQADEVFRVCAATPSIRQIVLLSSAAIYGASPQNPGLISESRPLVRNSQNQIASAWAKLESAALEALAGNADVKLAVLRPVSVVLPESSDYFGRLLNNRVVVTLPGHDPSIQLLAAEDLATAVCRIVEIRAAGSYNVAPDGVIPLRAVLRLARVRRLPIPLVLQRLAHTALKPLGLARSVSGADYIRYSWSVSNQKIKSEAGFAPKFSSSEAVAAAFRVRSRKPLRKALVSASFDDFGFDRDYLSRFGRTLFNFLERHYWRVEVKGIENLPREGPVVLVGLHRGFMPWDGIIAIHQIFKMTGRCPRFLTHPGLVKFPFSANFITKIGGVIACQQNADYILQRKEILGVFPEGVKGAFRLYRDAYQLGRFGRNDFVKLALRNQAPIVPFVTVGSAEIFPIVKRIEWSWWKRHTEWPFLPLTPTPLPLPSKWHTQFLKPIQLEGVYPPATADDPAVVRAISDQVKSGMESAIQQILKQRKSIFYGSVFEQEAV